MNAVKAYNLWAENYDEESGNLMLYFDRILFQEFLSETDLTGKVILDFGCGTGRYWDLILKNNPAKLIGCDISPAMINKLREKFPISEVYKIKNNTNRLDFLQNNSVDFIISTLVIAHIKNIKETIKEWNRILKKNGKIFITDFHPAALEKGGSRTFKLDNKIITIKNFIHPLEKLKNIFSLFDFKVVNENEKIIDKNVKEFYEKKNALKVYEKFKYTPIIYSIHFTKK